MKPDQNNNMPQDYRPVVAGSVGPNNPGVAGTIPPSSPGDTTPVNPAPVNPLTDSTPESTSPEKDHHRRGGWRSIISVILLVAIAPIIALCITAFVIQSYQVDGESMETTLQNNDRLIVDKLPRTWARLTGQSYIPNRGDIIIFNQANLPDAAAGQSKQLIKRVIGLPGDTVIIQNGSITIYNKAHPKGFNPDNAVGYHIAYSNTTGDIDLTLQAGQIFVCGDNRPNSEDSRYFGPIKSKDIVGKLVMRLLPLNKAQGF